MSTSSRTRRVLLGTSLAVSTTGVATLVQLALEPALGDGQPFILYVIAVMVTAWFAGPAASLLALALGTLAASFLVAPEASLWVDDRTHRVSLFLYLVAGLVSALSSASMRAAKERARRSELALSRMAAIVESSDDAIIGVSSDGRIVSWNEGAAKLFGYAGDEVVGEPVSILDGDAQREGAQALAKTSAARHVETICRRKDGSLVHVSLTISPASDGAGGRLGASLVARDITGHRRAEAAHAESERRLRFALEAGRIVAWNWDVPTGTVTRSENSESVLGLRPGSLEGTIEGFLSHIHPQDRPIVEQTVERALEGESQYDVEFRLVREGGEIRWMRDRGQVFRDAAGKPVRVAGITADVTERKLADEERTRLLAREKAAREEAESANRAKDDFLATISHELRTPLAAILLWSHALRQHRPGTGGFARAADAIDRSVKTQAKLVDDLLDFSRIISDRLRMDVKPVAAAAAVAKAVDLVRPTAEAKGIQLLLQVESPSSTVAGDETRLQQVTWNLLSNAIKFTPAGGRVCARVERQGDTVVLAVSDTGLGIRPEFLPHVFDRFRQADSTATRAHGGLGLGLAIVRHLVDLHGGTVEASSEGPGKGATFTVRLPALSAAPLAKPEDRASPPRSGGRDAGAKLAGLRVLLVEDEPDGREALAQVLAGSGAIVTAVASAAEAMEQLQRGPCDLVVSDIGMPEVDGYELIRRVRRLGGETGGIPAVALTGYTGSEDREVALAAGYQAHVAKPVEPDRLLAVIGRVAAAGARG